MNQKVLALMTRAKELLMSIKKLNDETSSANGDGGFEVELKELIDAVVIDAEQLLSVLSNLNNRYEERIMNLCFGISGYDMLSEIALSKKEDSYCYSNEFVEFAKLASRSLQNIKAYEALSVNSIKNAEAVLYEVSSHMVSIETLNLLGKLYKDIVEYVELTIINLPRVNMEYKEIIPLINHYFEFFKINISDVEKYIKYNTLPSVDINKMFNQEILLAIDELINEFETVDVSGLSFSNNNMSEHSDENWDEEVFDAYDNFITDGFDGFDITD